MPTRREHTFEPGDRVVTGTRNGSRSPFYGQRGIVHRAEGEREPLTSVLVRLTTMANTSYDNMAPDGSSIPLVEVTPYGPDELAHQGAT